MGQQIKLSESASGLSYTDPQLLEFVSSTELAEKIQGLDAQITAAEKKTRLKAEAEAKQNQATWAKDHPIESFLKNMSASIGDWWENVVEGTKNLSIPEIAQKIVLFGQGFLGAAGKMVSSVAIGGSELVHLGVEFIQWKRDVAKGVKTPQWKLDDLTGAWENAKVIGGTLKNVVLSK